MGNNFQYRHSSSLTRRLACYLLAIMSVFKSLRCFKILYILNVSISILIVILFGVWTGAFLNGLGWSESSVAGLQLNWHPLLMTFGFVFMQGNAILIYRGFRKTNKLILKVTHALLHLLSLPVIIVGLVAAFTYHSRVGSPNLYSAHSWIGTLSVVMFILQWLGGFFTFIPGVDLSVRTARLPLHIFFGLCGYLLSMLAICLGLTQRAGFLSNYNQLPPAGVLINCISLLVVLHSALLVFIVSRSAYKRVPLPGEAEAGVAE